jgi:hypothetical protein
MWKLDLVPEDDDFALSAAALQGPDLWIGAQVWDAFFLSDRLVRALREARLTPPRSPAMPGGRKRVSLPWARSGWCRVAPSGRSRPSAPGRPQPVDNLSVSTFSK